MVVDEAAVVAVLEDATRAAEERTAARRALAEARRLNTALERPSADDLVQQDSSIKKNSALMKKLRAISDANSEALCQEVNDVNQSRFLAEACSALLEAANKPSRVPAVLKVIEAMHRRYADFAAELKSAIEKQLTEPIDGDDASAVVRHRALLKLAVDLDIHGVCSTAKMLQESTESLARVKFKKADSAAIAALSQLTTFVRAAREDLLGTPHDLSVPLPEGSPTPQEMIASDSAAMSGAAQALLSAVEQLGAAMGERYQLHEQERQPLLQHVKAAFERSCGALEALHKLLLRSQEHNAQVLLTRGGLSSKTQSNYDEFVARYEAYKAAVTEFAKAWGDALPELQESAADYLAGAQPRCVDLDAGAGPDGIWDDQHQARFYESLPDLEAQVPALALHRGVEHEAAAAEDGGDEKTTALQESTGPIEDEDSALMEEEKADTDAADGQESSTETFRHIIEQLALCTNQERADELALEFCFIQTKGRRKALARALGDISRHPAQLAPFWARLVAALGRHYPDLAESVAGDVRRTFRGLLKSKDATQRTYEPRMRVARYLCELAKFRVVSAGDFFVCLKACLDDFSGLNIDSACELVTCAGAFMMRQADTVARMENMLAIMLRQRNSRNLEPSKAMLIDSANFACKPPPASSAKDRQRTPLQRYVRHLVMDLPDATESTTEPLVKRLRRLPFDECQRYIVQCVLKATVKGRYTQIQTLARIIAALLKPQPGFLVELVDTLLETIRADLENPLSHSQQARVAHVRLFADLYVFKVVHQQQLFYVLYLLIAHGHEDLSRSLDLDPPDDHLRLRLAFVVLGTCGHFFTRGSSRKKLQRYLLFLHRYVLSKEELPPDLEFERQALYKKLQPSGSKFETIEDVDEAITQLLQSEALTGAAEQQRGSAAASDDDDEDAAGRESLDGSLDQDDMDGDAAGEEEEEAEAGARRADDWLAERERQVDELFEKELAALLPAQGASPLVGPAASGATAEPDASQKSKAAADAPAAPVRFKVRLKRPGGRGADSISQIELPASNALAAKLAASRAQEEQERSAQKKLVLAAERRQALEEREAAKAALVVPAPGGKSYLATRKRDGGGGQGGQKSYTEDIFTVRGQL